MAHKESLEKMKNIAKMQRGEPHNRTLVGPVNLSHPIITDEDLARQSKILEELQARPLIIDRSPTLLTSKPLQRRKSTANMTIGKANRKQGSASPANAVASGSNAFNSNSNLASSSSVAGKPGNDDLLALLSTLLSKVDSPAPIESNPQEVPRRGKEKEQPDIDNALVMTLAQLLPLLSAAQSKTQTAASVVQTSSSSVAQPVGQWDSKRVTTSQQASFPPLRLFPTTEETFYAQPRSPHWPYDQHWAQLKARTVSQDPLKMSSDPHPVPGGAREKNSVPRGATSNRSPLSSRSKDQNVTKCVIDLTQPEKENMPPTIYRGLKRSSSLLDDGKEKCNEKTQEKFAGKKRKQDSSQSGDADAIKSSNPGRAVMGSVEENRASEIPATGPVRHTTTVIPSETMITPSSEPDFVRPRPVIASSSFPDIIMEPPKTPPRCTELLNQDAEDSLFTPDPKSTPRAAERSMTLYTPSPMQGKSRVTHVASDMLETASPHLRSGLGSDPQPVKTGWDLPPSSPPPPTSPASPHADIGSFEDDAVPPQLINHLQNEPDGDTDSCGKNSPGRSVGNEMCERNAMVQEATSISLGSSAPISAFDSLSEIDFNLELLDGAQGEMAVQNELDFDELWKTLGPVLVQAQNDTSAVCTNMSPEGQSFNFFEMSDDGGQTATDTQMDALTITNAAEELKALFSGCVV